MSQVDKTNAMRLLDSRPIPYETLTYDSAIHSASDVAAVVGLDAADVYKTLVVLREDGGRPLLVMVPSIKELDPSSVARSIGAKAVHLLPQREAERLTGLLVGGIGALALVGKGFDVYLDEDATERDRIAVNAGRRGVNLRLWVADLVALTTAKLIAVA